MYRFNGHSTVRKKDARGFTLIELLVVIAIIGLLASIILASLNTANTKGRDARRVSDVRNLEEAITLYSVKHNAYPNTLGALVTDGDISSLPTDPGSGTNYPYTAYGSGAVCSGFHLGAILEAQGSYRGVEQVSKGNGIACTGGAYSGTSSNGRVTLSAGGQDFSGGVLSGGGGAYVYDIVP